MIQQFRPENCEKCSLCKTRARVIPSILIEGSRVMFIGEAPGPGEEEKGMHLSGSEGKVFNEILQEAGINRSNVSITTVVSCKTPENGAPKPKEVEACFEFLDQEIRAVNPSVIVTLGSTPLKVLLKGVGGVTKVRGRWFDSKEYNCKILPTFRPSYILRNPHERNKMVADIVKVRAFLDGKTLTNEKAPTSYKVVRTQTQFDWLIDNLHKNDLWSFDAETTGLDFSKDQIFILTFSWAEYTSILIDFRRIEFDSDYAWERLKEVFTNNSKKIAHNGSFDIEFLMTKNIIIKNYYADTILLDYLLDENARHGLELLAERYTDMAGYDIPLTQYKLQNKIETYMDIPDDILYPYACGDTDVTLRSYNKMMPQIYALKLDFVLFNVMMPIQKILIQTEYDGVTIDVPYLERTIEKYARNMEEQLNIVNNAPQVRSYVEDKRKEIVDGLRQKWSESKTLSKRYPSFDDYLLKQDPQSISFNFNVNSSVQLKQLLLDRMKLPIIKLTKKENPCIDDEVLEEYSHKNAFCKNLSKYRSLSHLKSTFLDGIKNRLVNGRVHTDYLLFSTVTGRPSSRDPNLNNIPRTGTAEDIKDIFSAHFRTNDSSKRDWLIEVDQGQAEFRLLINYSKDPQALEDLREGIDVHKLIAASAYHGVVLPRGKITYEMYLEIVKDVKKDERQATKNIIFGLMYGRGAKSVAEQLEMSVAMAQKVIDIFFGRYRAAQQWLNIIVATAKRDGYVTSVFNRRRRLPNIKSPNDGLRGEAERQAKNSVIQSAASDLTFLACIEVYKKIKEHKLKSRLVLTVYDSLIFNVPDEELEYMSWMLHTEMRKSPSQDIIVPLASDIKIGKNWGSLVDVDMKKDWSETYAMLCSKFNN